MRIADLEERAEQVGFPYREILCLDLLRNDTALRVERRVERYETRSGLDLGSKVYRSGLPIWVRYDISVVLRSGRVVAACASA